MAGFVPAIHVLHYGTEFKAWMPGSSPGMTTLFAAAFATSAATSIYYPIAATASISISQPGRASRVTTTRVEAGGLSTLT